MLFVNSCHKNDKAIKQNALQYAQAMADYRVEDAKAYATAETRERTLQFFIDNIVPHVDSAYIASNTPATIEITSVEHLTDTSAIVHYRKKSPIQEVDASVEMRLRSGQWLAHQLIETTMRFGS